MECEVEAEERAGLGAHRERLTADASATSGVTGRENGREGRARVVGMAR